MLKVDLDFRILKRRQMRDARLQLSLILLAFRHGECLEVMEIQMVMISAQFVESICAFIEDLIAAARLYSSAQIRDFRGIKLVFGSFTAMRCCGHLISLISLGFDDEIWVYIEDLQLSIKQQQAAVQHQAANDLPCSVAFPSVQRASHMPDLVLPSMHPPPFSNLLCLCTLLCTRAPSVHPPPLL